MGIGDSALYRAYNQAEELNKNGFHASVMIADHPNLKKAIDKKFKILEEKDMIKLFKKDKEFARFLTTYLEGKEEFLL